MARHDVNFMIFMALFSQKHGDENEKHAISDPETDIFTHVF
jgi:hypothetical protein